MEALYLLLGVRAGLGLSTQSDGAGRRMSCAGQRVAEGRSQLRCRALCSVVLGNTKSSKKRAKLCGYMNLLSLLRISVSNLLYQWKEQFSCSNMFP